MIEFDTDTPARAALWLRSLLHFRPLSFAYSKTSNGQYLPASFSVVGSAVAAKSRPLSRAICSLEVDMSALMTSVECTEAISVFSSVAAAAAAPVVAAAAAPVAARPS
jgi:hypothetical protein